MSTVTVTRRGQRFVVQFEVLPGKKFGPWDAVETMRDLTVSALLTPVAARNLVLDAKVSGAASLELGPVGPEIVKGEN